MPQAAAAVTPLGQLLSLLRHVFAVSLNEQDLLLMVQYLNLHVTAT